MFKRLAKSRLADFKFGGFRPLQSRRIALGGAGLFNEPHSNDNLPGFRRPKGQRRIPTPALVCHWFNHHGRLECRWQAEPNGDAPISDFDEHAAAGRTSGLSSTRPRGCGLALAG
ncbi:hypothetical protein [Bradyrhizobium erythrophlei]|uniref:Uncharacterized protein n=1 Tax=Bradyrhizobium erythrophlei TaxID=1437360 RepID=A0A1M5Y078_9BRAD|nr:hypothetical protein [Bradyrhizobium erythrophlei]SHI04933.1 hypothetical protein SAMN05443248_7743 [Bradyrhizobium erythrophlei]